MSFHLGARQQAFLLTLDRNSAGGDSHHWHESTLFLLAWWEPFKALVPLPLSSLGEGTARKVAFGKELHDSKSCLSPCISLAILWALTCE